MVSGYYTGHDRYRPTAEYLSHISINKLPLDNCFWETLPVLYHPHYVFPFSEIHNAPEYGKGSKKSYCENNQPVYISLTPNYLITFDYCTPLPHQPCL